MQKTILKKYAKLIAEKGVNIKKGQDVMIYCDLDQPEFVKMLVRECYNSGARKVNVEWSYQPLEKVHYRYRTIKTLSTMEDWQKAKWQHQVDTLPCKIYLLSEDPDGLAGIDQHKMSVSKQRLFKIIKPYRDAMESRYQWCIAGVPGKAWAKKLFPGLRSGAAIEKLWQKILLTSRVIDEDGNLLDPVKEWDEHNKDLSDRCNYLNGLEIESLHYTSGNGTDFTVWMIPEARFAGGSEKTLSGNVFNPNIPTEECFISPMKGKAEGIVFSTKPLSYDGQLIEDFSIRFHEGKAVEWHAKKGEALLTRLINMDEGSAYLGECALVPKSSPINKSGILFYNTLYDENAACHMALGMGFPDTIKDFEKYTLEECRKMGINDSVIHEDFMIGSDDMEITAATRDGRKVQIFKNGTWAF